MGVLVPTEGPIKSLKNLTGKKIGVTAAGGDTPFLSSYLELVRVDPKAVTAVALDSQLIEQSVMTGQVDCMLAFGMSSIPNFPIQDFPVTLFPFSEVGLTFYWINTLVHPSLVANEPQLIADIVDGLMEGQKFAMLNPTEAVERHLEQYSDRCVATPLDEMMIQFSRFVMITRTDS